MPCFRRPPIYTVFKMPPRTANSSHPPDVIFLKKKSPAQLRRAKKNKIFKDAHDLFMNRRSSNFLFVIAGAIIQNRQVFIVADSYANRTK